MKSPSGRASLATDLRADPDLRGLDADEDGRDEPSKSVYKLWIRSRRAEQGFEFQTLPIEFQPGDVAAVAAVMPPSRRDGPIVAAANIDRNEKVDFVGREDQLLRYLGGFRRDYRRPRALVAAWLRGLAKGALLGLVGLAAAALWAIYGGADWRSAGDLLAAYRAGDETARGAIAIAAAIAIMGAAHGVMKGTWTVLGQARVQRRLLQAVWAGAAEALGFVQDHTDAFRLRSAEPNRPPHSHAAVRRAERERPQPSFAAGIEGLSGRARIPAFLADRD